MWTLYAAGHNLLPAAVAWHSFVAFGVQWARPLTAACRLDRCASCLAAAGMLEGLLSGAQAVQPQHPAIQRLCLLLEQQAAAANLVADSTSDRLSQDTAAMAIQEASQVSLFQPSKTAASSLQTCWHMQTVAFLLPAMGYVLSCMAQGLPKYCGAVCICIHTCLLTPQL